MNDGYTLNGYKYKYKSNEDVEYSEFIDIVANEYDEYELILEYDDIVIYPQYTQNAYTATLSIVQKSSNSTTVTLLDDWTSTDILTASVLTGNDYPNYNGTYTVTYQLFDISNYNVLGLYKNDYNGIPIDDVSDVDGSISKSNIITANTDFYIVIVSKINTVSLSLTLSSSDYVGGRAFEQDNPAVAYLTLNSDSTEYQILELETGDSFTIHYNDKQGLQYTWLLSQSRGNCSIDRK